MSKITRLERMRFSIATEDLSHCYICGSIKNDLHEVFHGRNRVNSMKWGCVIPVCRNCHNRIHRNANTYDTTIEGVLYKNITFDRECKIRMQHIFNSIYPDIDFRSIFYENYI